MPDGKLAHERHAIGDLVPHGEGNTLASVHE